MAMAMEKKEHIFFQVDDSPSKPNLRAISKAIFHDTGGSTNDSPIDSPSGHASNDTVCRWVGLLGKMKRIPPKRWETS